MKHACTRRMMRRSKMASAKGQPRGQMGEKTFTQLNYAQLQSDDLNLLRRICSPRRTSCYGQVRARVLPNR
jgi:hypothetical protein